jgi:hypothetical protein
MGDDQAQFHDDMKIRNEFESILNKHGVDHDANSTLAALQAVFQKWDALNKKRGNQNKVFDGTLSSFIAAARSSFSEKAPPADFAVVLFLMLKFLEYVSSICVMIRAVSHVSFFFFFFFSIPAQLPPVHER